jgi:dolichol-phosphate mannosyltransferase
LFIGYSVKDQLASANGYSLIRLVEALDNADVAIGSRYVRGIRILNWGVRRLVLSLAANSMCAFSADRRVSTAPADFAHPGLRR